MPAVESTQSPISNTVASHASATHKLPAPSIGLEADKH